MYGMSVAIWRTTIVVGAPDFITGAGRAYVFTKTATGWRQVAELEGSDSVARYDSFGVAVGISGTTIVVGASTSDSYSAGRAYVFTKRSTGWKQVAELEGSGSVGSNDFGGSVAISGTTVVVGGPVLGADVFTETAGGWKQTAELTVPLYGTGGPVGTSVAISGTTAVVGAAGYEDNSGEAYVFTETKGTWKRTVSLKYSEPATVSESDFGHSVAVLGKTIVVGAPAFSFTNTGLAYVFTKTGASWKQVAELVGSDVVAEEAFGVSVAISGTTAVVGALGFSKVAGRVYVFRA
jgi:hypothetical protein